MYTFTYSYMYTLIHDTHTNSCEYTYTPSHAHTHTYLQCFSQPIVLRILADIPIYCSVAPPPSHHSPLTLYTPQHTLLSSQFAHFCFIHTPGSWPHTCFRCLPLVYMCPRSCTFLRFQNLAFLHGFALALLQTCSFFLYQVETTDLTPAPLTCSSALQPQDRSPAGSSTGSFLADMRGLRHFSHKDHLK